MTDLIERLTKLREERGRIYEVAGDDVDVALAKAASELQSQSDRIAVLKWESDRLEAALRIELWNERMRRGGEQDAVIAQINKEIASIKAGRPQISLTKEGQASG